MRSYFEKKERERERIRKENLSAETLVGTADFKAFNSA